jgi:hypothetical protein
LSMPGNDAPTGMWERELRKTMKAAQRPAGAQERRRGMVSPLPEARR